MLDPSQYKVGGWQEKNEPDRSHDHHSEDTQ